MVGLVGSDHIRRKFFMCDFNSFNHQSHLVLSIHHAPLLSNYKGLFHPSIYGLKLSSLWCLDWLSLSLKTLLYLYSRTISLDFKSLNLLWIRIFTFGDSVGCSKVKRKYNMLSLWLNIHSTFLPYY